MANSRATRRDRAIIQELSSVGANMADFLGPAGDVARLQAALDTLIKSVKKDRATASWSEGDALIFQGVISTIQFPTQDEAKRGLAPGFAGSMVALGRIIEICLEVRVDETAPNAQGANGVGLVCFYFAHAEIPFFRFVLGPNGEMNEVHGDEHWSGNVSSEQDAQKLFHRALKVFANRLILERE